MNTTTAAAKAQVTVATIRTWCRRGVIAAAKVAGRWVIDTASLAHRIAIGAMRARKATVMPDIPIHLTAQTPVGAVAAIGAADVLKAAFEAGTTITLAGKFAGDRVYLGRTRQTRGSSGTVLETIGLVEDLGDHPRHPGIKGAMYVVDDSRLEYAPRLRQTLIAADEAAAEDEARMLARDTAYLHPDYE